MANTLTDSKAGRVAATDNSKYLIDSIRFVIIQIISGEKNFCRHDQKVL